MSTTVIISFKSFWYSHSESLLVGSIFQAVFFFWLPLIKFTSVLIYYCISIRLNLYAEVFSLSRCSILTVFSALFTASLEKYFYMKKSGFCSLKEKANFPRRHHNTHLYLYFSLFPHSYHSFLQPRTFDHLFPFSRTSPWRRVRTLFKIILKATLYNPSESVTYI